MTPLTTGSVTALASFKNIPQSFKHEVSRNIRCSSSNNRGTGSYRAVLCSQTFHGTMLGNYPSADQ